jgi:hypothetical protein
MFRVYSGPAGAEAIRPIEKGAHLFKEFEALDEAMSFARHLKRTGRVALLIEGDDGTHLDRNNLAKELHREASA